MSYPKIYKSWFSGNIIEQKEKEIELELHFRDEDRNWWKAKAKVLNSDLEPLAPIIKPELFVDVEDCMEDK
jgi:hypothetical protein